PRDAQLPGDRSLRHTLTGQPTDQRPVLHSDHSPIVVGVSTFRAPLLPSFQAPLTRGVVVLFTRLRPCPAPRPAVSSYLMAGLLARVPRGGEGREVGGTKGRGSTPFT